MNVIAGLGNPGAEYANTPHSIGFEAVDAIAREIGASWKSVPSFKGDLATGAFAGKNVILVKPTTFMNLSGNSVAPVVKYHNGSASDLIVILDDINLPVGKIRVRKGGSSGGHHGLESVIDQMGTPDFYRIRIGVGRDEKDAKDVVGHVLGKFDARLRPAVDESVAAAVQAAETLETNGLEIAMNRYNGWTAEAVKAVSGKENE